MNSMNPNEGENLDAHSVMHTGLYFVDFVRTFIGIIHYPFPNPNHPN